MVIHENGDLIHSEENNFQFIRIGVFKYDGQPDTGYA